MGISGSVGRRFLNKHYKRYLGSVAQGKRVMRFYALKIMLDEGEMLRLSRAAVADSVDMQPYEYRDSVLEYMLSFLV